MRYSRLIASCFMQKLSAFSRCSQASSAFDLLLSLIKRGATSSIPINGTCYKLLVYICALPFLAPGAEPSGSSAKIRGQRPLRQRTRDSKTATATGDAGWPTYTHEAHAGAYFTLKCLLQKEIARQNKDVLVLQCASCSQYEQIHWGEKEKKLY